MRPSASLNEKPVFNIRLAADVVAEPITWAVDQIVPSGMLTILSGKDKVGKTLFAWEIARAVCRGENFLGQFPATQGTVVFLGLDDPASVTVDRLEELGIREEPNLHVVTPLDCQPHAFTFWDEVQKQVDELDAQLVVVDALYLFLQGGSDAMNQAGGMAPVMRPLNKLAEETNASVLLITHDSKGGGDVAGSFVIRAAAKQILRLTGSADQSPRRTLHVEGKLIEGCKWSLEFKGPGSWRLVGEDAGRLAQTRDLVNTWLQEGNRGIVDTIARAISKRSDDVRTVLGVLLGEGSVTVESVSGGRGRPAQEYRWNFRPELTEGEGGTESGEPQAELALAGAEESLSVQAGSEARG